MPDGRGRRDRCAGPVTLAGMLIVSDVHAAFAELAAVAALGEPLWCWAIC